MSEKKHPYGQRRPPHAKDPVISDKPDIRAADELANAERQRDQWKRRALKAETRIEELQLEIQRLQQPPEDTSKKWHGVD